MFREFRALLRGALADRKGVTAAEYAILAVGIVILVGAAVAAFAPGLTRSFRNIVWTINRLRGEM